MHNLSGYDLFFQSQVKILPDDLKQKVQESIFCHFKAMFLFLFLVGLSRETLGDDQPERIGPDLTGRSQASEGSASTEASKWRHGIYICMD